MATANEAVADALIRHGHYLQRFGGGIVKRMASLLNRSEAEIASAIESRMAKIEARGADIGPATTKRLNELLAEIRTLNRAAFKVAGKAVTDELTGLATYEVEWTQGLLKDVLPTRVSVTRPQADLVRAAATSRPFQGRLLREWLDGVETAKAARIRDAIRIGVVNGETVQQMVRRIRGTRASGYADGLMEIDRRGAATLVRTAVNHTASAARDVLYDANADLISGLKWVATLDPRTCPVCGGRDGQVYPHGKGPRTPAHHGCRCLLVPALKSWKELGFEFDELPASTRASMSGQVPADMTYGQWLKRQTAAVQEDVLGAKKAAMFRTGKLPVEKFVDKAGHELTLKQLEQVEPAAFARAGLANPIKPPRGMPQDAVARFLQSPAAQQEMLSKLYLEEGLSYSRNAGELARIKAAEDYSASVEALAAVRYYTGEGYRPINRRMRESGGTLEDRQFSALAASAIDGMRRWDEPIWRAPTRTQRNADSWWTRAVVGEQLELGNQLQSFSASAEYLVDSNWSKGTDVMFRIRKPAQGAYIDPVSLNPGEHEVLLPPGLKYRVSGKEYLTIRGRAFRVIDLEIDTGE